MKKKMRVLAFLILIVLAAALPVSAATTITPKYCKNTSNYTTANNYAKTVSTGDYLVNIKNAQNSYLKFTPSSDGTYVFTVSALKDSKSVFRCGHVSFHLKSNNNRLERVDVKTQGGTNDVLKIATEDGDPGKDDPEKRYLRSRYAKISLKKGKPVFLYYSFLGGDSFRLNIKKSGSVSADVYYLANANNHTKDGCYSSSFKVYSDKLVIKGKMKKVKGINNYSGSYTSVRTYTFKLASGTKYYGSDGYGYSAITKSQALNYLKKMKSNSYGYTFVMLVEGNKIKKMYLKT